jgi:hypothetical protein
MNAQNNSVTEVWSAPAKVNSFKDLINLPIKTEASDKPVQETVTKQKRTTTPRELLRAALEYSLKHPFESTVDVAKKYSIDTNALYNARYRHKAKLEKPKVWEQSAVMTSAAPVKPDAVNHPAHYKTGGIETIDFIEAKGLTYNLGNVVKYVTRAGVKNKATHIEDLEKAAWYLNREIANLKGGA